MLDDIIKKDGYFVAIYSDYSNPNHNHEWMEIAYVLEGQGTNNINGVETNIKKGDYYFINPFSFHQDMIREGKNRKKAQVIVCAFTPSFIDPILKDSKSLDDLLFNFHIFIDRKSSEDLQIPVVDPLSTSFHDDDGYVRQLFVKCLEEYHKPQIGSEDIIRNNIFNILIVLLRNRNLLTKNSPEDPFSIIYKYMSEHYMDEITLDVVANLVGFSAQYVSIHFAEKTGGDNFKLTLKKIRVRNACRLLVKTNRLIDEISGLVGYRDIKSFYDAFKEITGVTPFQYRKSFRDKEKQRNRKTFMNG